MSGDEVDVLLIAGASAGAVAAVGVLGMWRSRWRTVRGALVAVALVSTLSVAAGVTATAKVMFISAHDLGVVLPVSVVAGGIGLGAALVMATAVMHDVRRVVAAARTLGGGDRRTGPEAAPAAPARIGELREIHLELGAAQTRLADARERERALETSRRELVAWVGHDLRTPLAGLRAMAEALEDGIAADPARYHRQMRREVDRLADLVDDLLELSRIQAGTLRLSLAPVDLREVVDDVVAGARPVAEAAGVHLGVRAAPAVVQGDAHELSRVLGNLLTNAVRHTPAGGVVEVSCGQDGDAAVLAVGDSCGGLTDEELARAFDAGWRGTPARTPRADGGAGLGLAIARGIAEAHGGAITVRNAGAGCRFEVRVPRAAPSPGPR